MVTTQDGSDVYREIGVTPVIVASGNTTGVGGSRLRPEVMEVMKKASTVMVEMAELNRQAGKVIAEYTGAEAALVCSGAAGGLVLEAVACIAGSDPVKMRQLPDTTGLKNEIIIQNNHRFSYDQCFRVSGAKLVGIGGGRGASPWELEGAITDRTAAAAYLNGPFVLPRDLTLEQTCEVAHAHGVPVIVDAALMLPPRANLRKYIERGADLVTFSGGKAIRGPQGTGILCGRADLIEAAAANASPNPFIGRCMKVAKEEIMGLLTALRLFVEEDEDEENRRYTEICQNVVDALIEIPGLDVTVEHDDVDWLVPTAVLKFNRDWNGPSREQLIAGLTGGDPRIFLQQRRDLAVDPLTMQDHEVPIVIRRLREELLRPAE